MARKSPFGVLVTLLGLAGRSALAEPPATPPRPGPAIIRIGAAYIAKQLCSCLFVTGRPETSCRDEFKPDIDHFVVSIERVGSPGGGSVRARLGPIEARADFAEGYGCVISQ
ncbi:MAG: hypothetical protein M3Y22_00570 [Pseudomonadota bacterium]|nr:hypothetical protein [Pseudomonadota bacterium]